MIGLARLVDDRDAKLIKDGLDLSDLSL